MEWFETILKLLEDGAAQTASERVAAEAELGSTSPVPPQPAAQRTSAPPVPGAAPPASSSSDAPVGGPIPPDQAEPGTSSCTPTDPPICQSNPQAGLPQPQDGTHHTHQDGIRAGPADPTAVPHRTSPARAPTQSAYQQPSVSESIPDPSPPPRSASQNGCPLSPTHQSPRNRSHHPRSATPETTTLPPESPSTPIAPVPSTPLQPSPASPAQHGSQPPLPQSPSSSGRRKQPSSRTEDRGSGTFREQHGTNASSRGRPKATQCSQSDGSDTEPIPPRKRRNRADHGGGGRPNASKRPRHADPNLNFDDIFGSDHEAHSWFKRHFIFESPEPESPRRPTQPPPPKPPPPPPKPPPPGPPPPPQQDTNDGSSSSQEHAFPSNESDSECPTDRATDSEQDSPPIPSPRPQTRRIPTVSAL